MYLYIYNNIYIYIYEYVCSIHLPFACIACYGPGMREDPRWILGGANDVCHIFVPSASAPAFLKTTPKKRKIKTIEHLACGRSVSPYYSNEDCCHCEMVFSSAVWQCAVQHLDVLTMRFVTVAVAQDRERLARLRQEKRDYAREFSQNSTWVRQQTEMGVWTSGYMMFYTSCISHICIYIYTHIFRLYIDYI